MVERHLRAVPDEGESINNFELERQRTADQLTRQTFDRTLQVVSDHIEAIHELAACKRTIRGYIERANECGARDRALKLELALEFLEEGLMPR